MNHLVGLLLIVVPVLLFQTNPVAPLNYRSWHDGQYRLICVCFGGLGGAIMARRDHGRMGYLWAAGAMAGATTAGLSFVASQKVYESTGNPFINVFILLLCAFPGVLVFLVVKRCSDYTFPEQQFTPCLSASYPLPTSEASFGRETGTFDFPTNHTTPLLFATKI